MIRRFAIALMSLIFLSTTAIAQSDDVPAAIKETFTKQYPAAEHVTYKDNLLNDWVEFTLGGENMRANYSKKGVWQNTEKEWSFDKLPAEVVDGFKKSKFADQEVVETKIIYRPGGTLRYRIKTRKNDLQKKYLFFNEKGQLTDEDITI